MKTITPPSWAAPASERGKRARGTDGRPRRLIASTTAAGCRSPARAPRSGAEAVDREADVEIRASAGRATSSARSPHSSRAPSFHAATRRSRSRTTTPALEAREDRLEERRSTWLSSSRALAELVVDRLELLVRRLELLVHRLELLVRRLELLVRRLELLVRRLELLVRRLELLDRRLQLLVGGLELALRALERVLQPLVARRRRRTRSRRPTTASSWPRRAARPARRAPRVSRRRVRHSTSRCATGAALGDDLVDQRAQLDRPVRELEVLERPADVALREPEQRRAPARFASDERPARRRRRAARRARPRSAASRIAVSASPSPSRVCGRSRRSARSRVGVRRPSAKIRRFRSTGANRSRAREQHLGLAEEQVAAVAAARSGSARGSAPASRR